MAITYNPYKTLVKFHNALDYTYRFVAGSPASGKSVGNFMELLAIALRQEPTPQGIRPTRFGIIRSTYGELAETTLVTMKHWLPREYTKYTHGKPIKVHCVMPLPDGTTADIHFVLLAIATVDDLGKLDSAEFTAIWLNEMSGLPAEVVGKAGERTGRYPPSVMWDDGKNHITYSGVIGDYNYPSRDHWIVSYLHLCDKMPENTILFEQPPALLEHVDDNGVVTYSINPEAENLVNLDGGKKYLKDLATYQALGKQDMIETRLLCRYGRAGGNGKPVVTNFAPRHISETPLKPRLYTDTLISVDTSGIHPCALFWQYYQGAWQILHGLYGDEMGLEEFIADIISPLVTHRYEGCQILVVCDPANTRDARTATTPTELFRQYGYNAITAYSNRLKDRFQAVETLLNRHDKGRLLISPDVTMLIEALEGGYQYKKQRAVGLVEVYSTTPLKNQFSHWADALQYGALHIIGQQVNQDQIKTAKRIAKGSITRGKYYA